MSSYDYSLVSSFQLELQYIDVLISNKQCTEEQIFNLKNIKQYLMSRIEEIRKK